ncbi:MAG TPA: prolipoprotein diacylglyceryl transferase family protein, partial [Chloroflexota bacterium]|nr:prolipoprotein diacylglyceryl transferase family protein [Chloroflexota bacterium]
VHAFAIMLNLGVAAGIALTVWLGTRRGVSATDLLDSAVWVIPAGLLGARLLYAVAHWPEYAPNPAAVLAFWEGGLALPGGQAAGLVAAWTALGVHRLPRGICLDAAAPGLALGQAIGRLGCLPAGCAIGVPLAPDTVLPAWPLPDSTGLVAMRFPSQVVEAGAELLLCAVLLLLWRRRLRPGTVAAAYLVGYGLLRLAAEPLRGDSAVLGPLPMAVWWSAIAVAAGLLGLLARPRRRVARILPSPES